MESAKGRFALTSFLAGGITLGAELLTSRSLSIIWGESLKLWAIILGVTLFGFLSGYLAGSVISRQKKPITVLRLFFLAGCLISISGVFFTQNFANPVLASADTSGILLTSCIILIPLVESFSSLQPVLVRLFSSSNKVTGNFAGLFLAISTLGGVICMLVIGFWGLEFLGLPGCWLGLFILAFLSVMILGRTTKWQLAAIFGIFGIVFFLNYKLLTKPKPNQYLVNHQSLGGELIVADIPLNRIPRRLLLKNRMGQTNIHLETGRSLWDYVHYATAISGVLPRGSKALLVGLGGGSLANELIDLGFGVDAIEIDPRMPEIARIYFFLRPEVNIHIDDARHYLNLNSKKFDLIVLDLFANERYPFHVLTLEAFEKMKTQLNTGGFLLINTHGVFDQQLGLGNRSLLKTLQAAGYETKYVLTPGEIIDRNGLIIASDGTFTVPSEGMRMNGCCKNRVIDLAGQLAIQAPHETEGGTILTDDLPILDHLNQEIVSHWRQYAIDHYLLPLRDLK